MGYLGQNLGVKVRSESGTYLKEVNELSVSERRSLDPAVREYVAEQLLDRYLAEQGYVDLIEKRRPYAKKIQDITAQDLPALLEAERYKAEEHEKRCEREQFVRDLQEDLDHLRFTA
jgi:hypothetical protein